MDEIFRVFKETGAILDGHFLLSSGLHSPLYVQCARVLQFPDKAAMLCACLAERFQSLEVESVIAPAVGGILVAHEVARSLGKRAIFTERRQGKMQLRRGFELAPDERVVAVEDVVTTGNSLGEVINIVRDRGGVVVGLGALLDRSGGGALSSELPLQALVRLQFPTYPPGECPLCHAGMTLDAPGSHQLG